MVIHVLVIKKWNFKHYTSNEYSSMERHAEGISVALQRLLCQSVLVFTTIKIHFSQHETCNNILQNE
jgi:hypothetical protein